MPIILREICVLCLGVVVAGVAAIVCRLLGNKLELLPGVVVPIVFCLGRLVCVPGCSNDMGMGRRVACQLLRAFALITLLLFEMGVGLFIEARDIPFAAWAVVGGFGAAYVFFIHVLESLSRPFLDGEAGLPRKTIAS